MYINEEFFIYEYKRSLNILKDKIRKIVRQRDKLLAKTKKDPNLKNVYKPSITKLNKQIIQLRIKSTKYTITS